MNRLMQPMVARSDGSECPTPSICPLNKARVGTPVRIKQLCASNEVVLRLREMGLGEEQTIKLVTAQSNIICQVCNARLAISPQLAQTIMVEPLELARAV